MPRLKKKYMEKHAKPKPPVVAVKPEKPLVPVVSMTLRDAAARYGLTINIVRGLVEKYGITAARMGLAHTILVADMDALWAKLGLCGKLNADPYLLTLPVSKRWEWRPRKPNEVIAPTSEQAHAETRAVEYALATGIPLTTRDDGAFVFLDLQGLICFPSSEDRPLGYGFANVK